MSSVCERGVAGVLLRCGATPAAVYVSILSELGHVGDNITVQCRVVGVSDLVPRVRWVKSAVGDSAEQTVADGERIVAPYDRLARYFASLTPLSQVTLYHLNIYCESTRVGKSHDFKKTKNQIVCAAFFNKVLLRCSLRLILNE